MPIPTAAPGTANHMANPFTVAVPNVLEALMAGEQGYKTVSGEIKQRQVAAVREQAAQSLMQGGDSRTAIAKLMGIGDIQGAQTLAGMENNNRDFQFRQQEAQRSQGNADRSFNLQETAARDAARGFDYREVDDGSGGKTLVKINKATGQVDKVNVAGAAATPNNPFAYGKQNEGQSKDSGYANRMFQSEGILRDPKSIAAGQSSIERAIDKAPILGSSGASGLGNYIQGADYQRFDQAARDFINATLRRESGAAISASEFDNAYKQYLPRPGDSKEVLAQKQKNRQATIASIAGGGGASYKPPFSFGPNGEMLPTGNAQQGSSQAVQQTPAQPPQNSPVKISSAQERDALPPGAQYIAPDGSLRTKQ